MRRSRKHHVKNEEPEPSTSTKFQQEHDLAYYIHDRVELMHQVFNVLKQKEIKAMVPECVKNISIDDLQELCTEELLGISSKRLLAVLDGAEPPSDTESSSRSPSPQLETISLDSISSDDEVLNDDRKKKKHKHHRNSKSKTKDKKKKKPKTDEAEQSTASRAGLTVLELLELQARARAIRAQLQQERDTAGTAATAQDSSDSDNEVEIKEEPLEVLVISSEDEKPDVEELKKKIKHKEPEKVDQPTAAPSSRTSPPRIDESTQALTKRCNDLIVKVPQANQKRKIKLKRKKATSPVENESAAKIIVDISTSNSVASVNNSHAPTEKRKKKKKKREKQSYNIDNDEITLQLSDSEKMDLLQDLEKKQDVEVESDTDTDSSEDTNKGTKSDTIVGSATVHVEELDTKIETVEGEESEKKENTTEKELPSVEEISETVDANESAKTNKVTETAPTNEDESEVIVLKDDHLDSENNDETKQEIISTDDGQEDDEIVIEDTEIMNVDVTKEEVKSEVSDVVDEETVCISDDEANDVIQVIDEIELSDDSCSEVSILSNEPTAEEIATLSAKIDEMEENEDHASEQLSWKERYVESNKVKKVLTVANIFNALRKKNIELKKSMQELEKAVPEEVSVKNKFEDGTIEQYNTLESSGKYDGEAFENDKITADMKKDAKVLLKMYKKLLKYNDMMRVSKKKMI